MDDKKNVQQIVLNSPKKLAKENIPIFVVVTHSLARIRHGFYKDFTRCYKSTSSLKNYYGLNTQKHFFGLER